MSLEEALIRTEKTVEQTSKEVQAAITFFTSSSKENTRFFKGIITEIKTSVTSMNALFSNYMKNEADIIEKEINGYVRNYLINDTKFKFHNIFDAHDQWKNLRMPEINQKTGSRHSNNDLITEFDGIFVITDDIDYSPQMIGLDIVSDKAVAAAKASQPKTQFVVVEAKHSISNVWIDKKIEQMKRFQQYIKLARQTDLSTYTQEFRNKKDIYKLYEMSEEIILIFGSEDMDISQELKIKNGYDDWARDHIFVSYLKPFGDRYQMFCKNETTQVFDINDTIYKRVRASELVIGTGGKTRKAPLKTRKSQKMP